MASGEKDDFLSRWSRRKREVAEDDAAMETALVEQQQAATALAEEPLSEEAQLEKLRQEDPELAEKIQNTDIEKLQYEDDFAVFLNKKVPEFLRRKALSRLWMSNPILANIDGLNDYDDDFTDAATVIENFQSAYQPGRGYKKEEVVEEEELLEEEEELITAQDDETPEEEEKEQQTPDDETAEEGEQLAGDSEDEEPDAVEDDV